MVLIPMFRLIGRAVLLAALCAGGLAAQNCKVTSVGLIPLPDLGSETYQDYPGGLYPSMRRSIRKVKKLGRSQVPYRPSIGKGTGSDFRPTCGEQRC